ncbi:hypothetical protein [Rhodococcus sp. NPDC047139]|uniref:hypothetical protein n=1 Tax=Rhodococcus sp. NPDC047139 TaxID=3155141 RepID=UPI0033E8DC6D
MTAPGSQQDIVTTLVAVHAQYPSVEGGCFYDEVLLEVPAGAERDGSIGKGDVGALLLWKRLNLSTVWSRDLNEWPDRKVRAVTARGVRARQEHRPKRSRGRGSDAVRIAQAAGVSVCWVSQATARAERRPARSKR